MENTRRRVLNTLLLQTNEQQGAWTSEHVLKTILCAHTGLDPNDIEEAAFDLAQRGLIEYRDNEYQPADGVSRESRSGEKT